MSWFRKWFAAFRERPTTTGAASSCRPSLEQLETREVLSTSVPSFQLANNGDLLQHNASGQTTTIDRNVREFQVAATPTGRVTLFDIHTNGDLRERNPSGQWSTLQHHVTDMEVFSNHGANPVVDVLSSSGLLSQFNATTKNWSTIAPSNVTWWQGVSDSNGNLFKLFWLTRDGSLWEQVNNGKRYLVHTGVKQVQVFSDHSHVALVILGKNGALWVNITETNTWFTLANSNVTWWQGVSDPRGNLFKLFWLTANGNLSEFVTGGARYTLRTGVKQVQVFSDHSHVGLLIVGKNGALWEYVTETNTWFTLANSNVTWWQGVSDPRGNLFKLFWLTANGNLSEFVTGGARYTLRTGVKQVQVFSDHSHVGLLIVGKNGALWEYVTETNTWFTLANSNVTWWHGVADANGKLAKVYWLLNDGSLWQKVGTGKPTQLSRFVASVTVDQHGNAHWTYDQIGQKWAAMGKPSWFGSPLTGRIASPDGKGYYVRFGFGVIYWTPQAGVHVVDGTIYQKWLQLGGAQGALGTPTSDLQGANDGSGNALNKIQLFSKGAIFLQNGTNLIVLDGKAFSLLSQLYNALTDPTIKELVRSLVVEDGQLNRQGMVRILRAVQLKGTVTRQEFGSLQKLISLHQDVNMPDSVRDLASKVVNGDPANATFQGRSLGNLHVGSSSSQLNLLINKWLYGADRPNLTDDNGNSRYTYQEARGSLFGSTGQPSYQQVFQGLTGDCYFLASLAELALRDPQALKSMIVDNRDALYAGDDTFTVRFWNSQGNTWDYVTVDRWFPGNAAGQFVFANLGHQIWSLNNTLWVPLIEKAYAEEVQEGHMQRPATDSYQGISSGWPYMALDDLTGKAGSHNVLTNGNAVVTAWKSGKMVVLNSGAGPTSGNINPNHSYAVVGYNNRTGMFTLFNPWGVNGGTDNGKFQPGLVQMNWGQLSQNFTTWDSASV